MTGNEIRLLALEAVHKAGKGHIGGVLSCADILAVIYSGLLRPQDRFLLSKGHCAVGLYAALELAGILAAGETLTLNQEGRLGEHQARSIPGVIADGGSLGHGLSLACGLALADKLSGSDARTYILLGDGDCLEGQTWEAAMFGGQHFLNITVVVDRNGLITGGDTEEICGLVPLVEKWRSFGWDCVPISGHERDLAWNLKPLGPTCFIARTIKGKGVSFMEGKREWHHGSITAGQMNAVREELRGNA